MTIIAKTHRIFPRKVSFVQLVLLCEIAGRQSIYEGFCCYRYNRSKSHGIRTQEISHIRTAWEKGIGNIDNIEILGSKLDDVRHVFKRN